MGLRSLDILVVALYMIALVIVGLRVAPRQTTTEAYFTARRSIPSWALGMSMLATIISAVTVVAYPGAGYAGNWSMLVPGIMVIVVLAVVGAVVIPFYRQAVGMSAYEYFGSRFAYPARVYASLAFSLGTFSKMAFVVYLVALTIASMTGWRVDSIVFGVGAITIFFTLIGGLEAVIWADVVQGFVLWAGVVVCIGCLLFLTPGGPSTIWTVALENHKFDLGSTRFAFSQPTIIVLALYGFFWYLQKYTADQTMVQRYLAAKSDKDAVRGVLVGAVLCIPVWTLFMLIGTQLWAFYRITGEALPANITKPDQIFPYFVSTHFAPGIAGLFMAALFGAAMATLASDLNCLSVVVVEDIYCKLWPHASDRTRLQAAKCFIAVGGLLTIICAVQLAHSEGTALSLWYTISAIVAGGLAGLFLLAFLCERANTQGAYAGILANLLFTAWATLTLNGGQFVDLGRFNFPLHSYTIAAIGHVLLLAVGYLASLLFHDSDANKKALTLWGWRRKRATGTETSMHGRHLKRRPFVVRKEY
jgi:SSS family solute:Na+ symporter